MIDTRRLGTAVTLLATALAGCYVVPVTGPDGTVQYHHYPMPPAGTPAPAYSGTYPSVSPGPTTLAARLYPANDVATQTGVVNGSVTNLMSGKGRFMVEYQGELLSGEATRISNDERRGVASAYSPKGMFMSCEYQMNTPYQGAGTCTFSNGAKYQLHVGGK
jgi:hypothetical protein